MGKIIDNEFSKSFISHMLERPQARQVDVSTNISRIENLSCWQQQIPYLYKDAKRIRKKSRFVRANADGSEDIVELLNPRHTLYCQGVKFKKIKRSREAGKGELYKQIKK